MNFKENEKEEIQKYSIERDSSYDDTIKNLESTNFGIFIKSHTDFIQQMFSLKLYDNEFPTLHHNGSGFYTWLCLIAVRRTGQQKNLIRRMEKIGCVTTINKVYI